MPCRNNNDNVPLVRAESVAVAADTAAITIPDITLVAGSTYDVALFTSVPVTTSGNAITIQTGAAGATALPVLNRLGSNARPKFLTARQILRVMYLGDPEHFLLLFIRG